MTIKEAMRERHSVRRYTDKKIPTDIAALLNERIAANNSEFGLDMKLILGNEKVVKGLANLTFIKGAVNFIILAGKDSPDLDEKLGYCGTDVMLYAQTLGLNSVWLGGTYNKKEALRCAEIPADERMTGIIVVGYGETQGAPHKSKPADSIASYNGEAPGWFRNGVEALLLAPTAINRQGFTVRGEGNTVTMTCSNGVFSGTDLGIGKYHFELDAGKENFKWKEA